MKSHPEKSTDACPKCGAHPFVGAKECLACGLVFKKWTDRELGALISGSERLEMAWQLILSRWEEDAFHESFIAQATLERNLGFASMKYRRILEADPHNEVALKRQAQILQTVLMTSLKAAPVKHVRPYLKWVYALLGFTVVIVLVLIVLFLTPR
ncbi:MAG: hypothetical protein AB7F59_05530 [Bdellovibrionales bacterium]